MRLNKYTKHLRAITRNELRKCRSKPVYIISVIYLVLIILITLLNRKIQEVFSGTALQLTTGVSIEESIYVSIYSRGFIIFAIMIIVVFAYEMSQNTFNKSLVTGYDRFALFVASFIRINLFIILYLLLSLLIILAFRLPVFEYPHEKFYMHRFLSLYLGFLYTGMFSFLIVLLTRRIYLSIILCILIVASSSVVDILNDFTLKSDYIILYPFIILKYLRDPSGLLLHQIIIMVYIIYLLALSQFSFYLLNKKKYLS